MNLLNGEPTGIKLNPELRKPCTELGVKLCEISSQDEIGDQNTSALGPAYPLSQGCLDYRSKQLSAMTIFIVIQLVGNTFTACLVVHEPSEYFIAIDDLTSVFQLYRLCWLG